MRFFAPGIYLAVSILSLTFFASQSYAQSYGLGFSSHEVVQDKRSTLDLNTGTAVRSKNNLTITFDLSFMPGREIYFGYILRLVNNSNQNIDLVYDNQANTRHFKIIIGDHLSKIDFNIDDKLLYDQWNKIKINIDFKSKNITLYTGNKKYTETAIHFKQGTNYKLLFGANAYKQFQSTDLPPMKVREVKVWNELKLACHWPLNEGKGNVVHEVIDRNNGTATNPIWMKARHCNWQLDKEFTVHGIASTAFDAETERIHIITSDSLITYSDRQNPSLKSYPYLSGKQDLVPTDQSIYEHGNIHYILADQNAIPSYNLKSQQWNKHYKVLAYTNYGHLNKFFSKADSSLYMVGGYGQLIYKDSVKKYTLATGLWQDVKVKGDTFTPRYLAGLGTTAKGDTAYIMGGYGSASGQQIVNPRNLYDMMRFTVKDGVFKKMFNLTIKGEDFVFANSLVIDSKSKTYYGLIFPQHKYHSSLRLITGSLDNPAYKLGEGTIPYLFLDTHSFADLYYCPRAGKFLAVTIYKDNNQTKIKIYSLLNPPESMVNEEVMASQTGKVWMIVIGLLVLGAGGIILYRKKLIAAQKKAVTIENIQQGKINQQQDQQAPLTQQQQVPAQQQQVLVQQELSGQQPSYQNSQPQPEMMPVTSETSSSMDKSPKNSIFLFGDLQLFAADGTEITKYFTPLLKELFLVVLLYSTKLGRGVSSEKLNEILWFDKTEKSARNNRSVNIAKLKALLDKMGPCHLSKDTGFWKIEIDNNAIFVDYQQYLNIVSNKNKLDKQKIKQLTCITHRGNFLTNIEYEWLDTFKSDVSNEIIDTYLQFANSIKIADDPEFLVKLANDIFYFDPVNEEAMVLKCKTLSYLGKHSLAKTTFENFSKEYKVIYGENFEKDFHSILT